jgi:diamine N-acetyltransferase
MVAMRSAVATDAGPLAELAERTFRDTFSAQNTKEDMDLHCAASFGTPIQAGEIADPRLVTLVGDDEGALVAYGQLRWGAAPEAVPAVKPAEIARLYVDRRWHGRGLAHQLMSGLLSAAAAGGADTVWLGVWEHNPRAIAFYRKHGFVEVGSHVFRLGRDPQRDLLMARPMEATAAGRR